MSSASSSAASNIGPATYGNTVSGNGSSGGASTWLLIGLAAAVLVAVWIVAGRKKK